MTAFASCCVLSFERPEFLRTGIESLVANAGAPLELIVHDDGSSEGEVYEVLDHVRRQYGATIITNAPGHNQGVGESIRRAFACAGGSILAKIDQDLTFAPGWLAAASDLLEPIEGRIVPLTDRDGNVHGCTLVDAADWERVEPWRWRLHSGGYAYSAFGGRTVLLHRLLMDEPPQQVDHRNRRKLDNRRDNLRLATPGENQQNRGGGYGSSVHRGVSWSAKDRRWCAFGKLNGRSVYLGSSTDEEQAARLAATWRREHMPFAEEPVAPQVGMLGLFKYHHEPVDAARTLIARHSGWEEHTHFCGSAFLLRREVYEALGIATHSPAFAEDWELMKLVTTATPFACALPERDLATNRGFGIGPSTVVVAAGQVREIHDQPHILGR